MILYPYSLPQTLWERNCATTATHSLTLPVNYGRFELTHVKQTSRQCTTDKQQLFFIIFYQFLKNTSPIWVITQANVD